MSLHLVRDIDALHRDILSMGAQVEEMVHKAVDALYEPDVEKTRELAAQDDEIDDWDVRIEENCLKILALNQPVAIDLRRITSVLKISSELERVADLAVHIAERAEDSQCPALIVPDKLKRMAELAVDMLHRSIDAYVEFDSAKARQVCIDDENVDQLQRELIHDLEGRLRELPDVIPAGLHLFSACRHLERVADHATNIAEDVVYLVEGRIIRHGHNVE